MGITGKKFSLKRHFLVLLATLLIFGSGFFLSNFVIEKKFSEISRLQQGLSIDILSLETQFSLLAQAPCKNLKEASLTKELYDISKKLELLANTLGEKNPDFILLKKYYSVLEIKHWLSLKRAAKDCKLNLVSIIYFYSDKKNCPDCEDQGYLLTYFREKHPFLRVYSFDYDLALSALETLKSIYKLEKKLPIVVVNDEIYYGFKNKEELEEILSQYIEESEEKATSTQATSSQPAPKKK